MPIDYCESCGTRMDWSWEEAFDKFGFNDGDGLVRTEDVAECLREAELSVESDRWGLHNVIIISIKRDGVELLPFHRDDFRLGYDDPRGYLPNELVALLDRKLPA